MVQAPGEELELPNLEDMELVQASYDPVFLNNVYERFQTVGTIEASNEVYEANIEACIAERRYKDAASKIELTFYEIAGILRRDNNQPCLICDTIGQIHSDYCKGLSRVQHFEIVYEKFGSVFDESLHDAHGYDAVMKILYFLEIQDRERIFLEQIRDAINQPAVTARFNQDLAEMAVRHERDHRREEDVHTDHADSSIARDMKQKNRVMVQFRAYLERLDRKTDGKKFTNEDQFQKRNKKIRQLLKLRNSFQ